MIVYCSVRLKPKRRLIFKLLRQAICVKYLEGRKHHHVQGLIFEVSRKGRRAKSQWPVTCNKNACDDIPAGIIAKRYAHIARSVRVASGASLYEFIQEEFFDRYAFLSAGFLHHEI